MAEDKSRNTGFFKNLDEFARFHDGGIFSKVLAKSETFNYTLMCLSKGSDMDTHTSTKNGCVIVLKGKGVFRLFDKDIVMVPHTFIFFPANAPHSLRADEDLSMLLCLAD